MTTRTPTLSWDDPAWKEADTPMAASLRRRQGRYRQEVLKLPAGPRLGRRKDGTVPQSKLVVSMLPLEYADGPPPSAPDDAPSTYDNFLNADVRAAVHARLGKRSTVKRCWPRSIGRDRLFRNMLSSQPVAFNFFGNVVGRPQALLAWVQRIDPAASTVTEVRIEWAPHKRFHLNSGSAFDAWVSYRAEDQTGFVAVEVKYSEDLSKADKPAYQPKFEAAVGELGCWKDGSYEGLNTGGRQQFMLNTSLAQSLLRHGDSPDHPQYQRGHAVVMACDEDGEAKRVTNEVAGCLQKGPEMVDLTWLPLGESLELMGRDEEWVSEFRERYLADPS